MRLAVIVISLISIIVGLALATLAPKGHPVQQAILESMGGSLIVLGLTIIGVATP